MTERDPDCGLTPAIPRKPAPTMRGGRALALPAKRATGDDDRSMAGARSSNESIVSTVSPAMIAD